MAHVVSAALAAADPDPALLKALATHDARMEQHLDAHEVTVDAVTRDLDGDGKVKHTGASKLKQRRVNGKLRTTVVWAKKDGADDHEAEQKRAAERDEKNERTESPFAARNQAKYRFQTLGPAPQAADQLLVGFEPRGDKVPEVLEGMAFVDPAAGEVVKLIMKPSKLPMFADAMHMEIEYENRTASGRNISKFLLAGAGGLLFVKRRGDLTLKFTFE